MPNEAGKYVGGILGLLGGFMAAKGSHERTQAEEQLKREWENHQKNVIEPAVQEGDVATLKQYEPVTKKYLGKDASEALTARAQHNAQTKGFTGMMSTLQGMMKGNEGDAGTPTPSPTPASAPGAGMTEQNITGQPSALPVSTAGPLRPQTAFPENPVPGQGAGIGSPAAPTAVPAATPAAAPAPTGRKSMVQQLRDIGLQPEISTDAKGNVLTKTVPLPKLTPEETKSQAMVTVAKDEVKNLPPEQQPVAMAKSFLRQSVDLIRAGHVPNSLEANTAYGITESAHNAFPDDADSRAKYIVAASQAAKQYQEQNDPKLKMEQKRYDLSVQQYNRELANDRENVRAKAEGRLDTEINQVQAQIVHNQNQLTKNEPGIITAVQSTLGGKVASEKYKTYGALQTQIARDQEHLQRLQQLQSSYANAKNPPVVNPLPTATPTGAPPPAAGPGAQPTQKTPPNMMHLRNQQDPTKEVYYPVGPTPAGWSRLQ